MAPRKISLASAKKNLAKSLFDMTERLAALESAKKNAMKSQGLPEEMMKELTEAMNDLKKAQAAVARAEKKAAAEAAAAPAKPFATTILNIYDDEPGAVPAPATVPAELVEMIRERRAIAKHPEDLVSHVIERPEQLGEIIDMRRAYRKEPNVKTLFWTNYHYDFKLVGNGCELSFEFNMPDNIEAFVQTKTPATGESVGLSLSVMMTHKMPTNELKVTRIELGFAVEDGAAMLSDAAIADQVERVIAMFHNIRAIAPLVIGEKLNAKIKVGGQMSAAEKKAIKKLLTDMDIARQL